jgi:hypothetical protein
MIKKTDKTSNRSTGGAFREMICGDRVILRDEGGAVIYGCVRILRYGERRLCFATRGRSISLTGRALVCTAFSAGCVTVGGVIDALCFCERDCNGRCQVVIKEEASS